MQTEQKYYEIDKHWTTKNVRQVDSERIIESFHFIPKDVKSIADIGCGNGIFINYVQTHSKIKKLLGIDNSKSALKYVNTLKIQSDIKSIPIKDKEYDLTVAFELIEHLSYKDYQLGLKEICRLAKKYVMVSVPNNEILIKGFVQCPQCETKFHKNYHKRSFNKTKMRNLLKKYSFEYIETKKIGTYKTYWLLTPLFYILKRLGLKVQVMKYPSICPMCGYTPTSNLKKRKSQSFTSLILDKIWPKKINSRWLLALYRRK